MDRAQRAAALFKRWLEERGDFEALCREHRELEPELRRLRQARELLEQAGLAACEVTSFAERLKEQHGSGLDPHVSLHEETGQPGEPPTSQLYERLREHAHDSSRYRLKGEIARGGMGAILEIWDEDLRRNLAMKVILGKAEAAPTGLTPPVDRRLLARFLEEAQVTGQLDHPGIVPVHELGLDSSGRVYFTMKLVRGRDLKAIFDLVFSGAEGWNETRSLSVILKVCEAMAYAHKKGVIHRDLKPANVMVGSFGEVYVMDWGLARVLGQKDNHDLRLAPEAGTSSLRTERREERADTPDSPLFTMDGDVVGTPSYMPPEQARGEIERLSARSDVYSIGAILYHLLARRMPYCPPGARVTNRAVLGMVLHGPPPPIEGIRDDIPAELVAICEKAMAREASERYASTLELAEDLQAYLEGRVVRAHQTGAWAETRKWVQRNKPLAASLAAAVLLLVAGLATSLIFKARADERAADLQTANTTIEKRSAELQERERAARRSLYVAAVTGAQSALRYHELANVRRLLDSAPTELRDWEWRCLDAASDTSLLVLQGEPAAFSPDGARIVTASNDYSADEYIARVWDTATGKELIRFSGHTSRITSAAYSLDGTRVLTASDDETARVWEASTGKEVARLEVGGPFASAKFSPDGTRLVCTSIYGIASMRDVATGQELARFEGRLGDIRSANFSPDAGRLVAASIGSTASVWDAATGKELARLEGHTASVNWADFSPDGTCIVTAAHDHTARVWDAATGKQFAFLEGHTSEVTYAAFSSDGTRIVTTSADNIERVWDAKTGKEVARLEGHTDAVRSAAFSPDGSRIVTASADNTARVWDATTGKEVAQLEGHMRPVRSAAFSSDGMHILTSSADGTSRVWDSAARLEFARLEGKSLYWLSSTFSPDRERIVTAARNGAARVWNIATGKELARLEGHTLSLNFASFSPDGARIVTASDDESARMWDAATGKELICLEGHAGKVNFVAFSPDGKRIVTTSEDKSARIWDTTTGKELARLEGHAGPVYLAAFRPDGKRIVTTSEDSSARVWDATIGKELARLEGRERPFNFADFSPDGTRIITIELDTARGWDAETGRELFALQGQTMEIACVLFSPDRARIVTASEDKTARVWDTTTGKELARLEGHAGPVYLAAFRPDGKRIVTTSEDSSARVWDAATGQELARLEGHTAAVLSAAFSPDGTRIVTASEDGTARVWDAVTAQELARLEGHEDAVTFATFSLDGTRIVTVSEDNTARVWDSVPYRTRYAEHQALQAARPTAERALVEAFSRSASLVEAAARIRNDPALEPIVRHSALDLLSERCVSGQEEAHALEAKQAERDWLARMLGLQPWPNESDVEAELDAEASPSTNANSLNGLAWLLVNPDAPPVYGKEVRALLLSRWAVASADAKDVAMYRDTLARALYRLGRFEEALAEQRAALAEAPVERQADFQDYLQRLESDIAAWRGESGNLRRAEQTAWLDALTREIAELEQDPDVLLWLGKGQ